MDTPLADDDTESRLPERPLECQDCKKSITRRFTEVGKDMIHEFCSCSDCPVFARRLKGTSSYEKTIDEGVTSLACGDCGTTLELLRVGQPLGCSHCYVVFEDPLLQELKASGKLPSKINSVGSSKRSPIHVGRIPGQVQEMNPSLRLLALNEALNETLRREDYEQAAWLRDQIKALTEENPEKGDDGT